MQRYVFDPWGNWSGITPGITFPRPYRQTPLTLTTIPHQLHITPTPLLKTQRVSKREFNFLASWHVAQSMQQKRPLFHTGSDAADMA